MGTHAAMAITTKRGEHWCTERTLRGDLLVGNCTDFRPLNLTRMSGALEFGMGEVEHETYREREQEYYVHVNWEEKYIGLNDRVFAEMFTGTPKEIVDQWTKAIARLPGVWELRWEDDCPAGSSCYDEE